MLASRSHLPRPLRLVLVLLVVYAFCWIKGWPRYYDEEELPNARPQSSASMGPHTVSHDQLIVSITTTATNAYSKLAPSLIYLDKDDHEQLLLFSDLQMEIGKWPVFDVLWRYSQNFIVETKDLARYRAQVDYSRKSMPMRKLVKRDPQDEEKILARLYKYKILQTMAAAWEYRPDRKWYAFVDDETYIHRPNLLDWLSQYDSQKNHLFGNAPTAGLPDPFAAGGTSFILSQKAMKELFKERKDVIRKWQNLIFDHASALELVTAVVQSELGLGMDGVWPGISGFDPTTVPFSPALWCVPILMMHHVSSDMASDLWHLEKHRADNHLTHTPLRFADMWEHFMEPENLNFTRSDWDNLSAESSNSRWNILFEGNQPDPGRAPSGEDSEDACARSCDQSQYCMQWSYSSIVQNNWNDNPKTKCHLSSSLRFGAHSDPQEWLVHGEQKTRTYKSGWRKDKFARWAKQQRCKAQHQR